MSRAGQKRLEQVGYRLTADRARSFQATGTLDARGLMATGYKRRVNRSIQTNAAGVITCNARASALPPFHVLVKVNHELAWVLQRSSPFTVFWIIPQHICKEPASMPSDDENSAVHVLNVVRKCFQISRALSRLPFRGEPRRNTRDLFELHRRTAGPHACRNESSLEPWDTEVCFTQLGPNTVLTS